jgi:hypothetical protein
MCYAPQKKGTPNRRYCNTHFLWHIGVLENCTKFRKLQDHALLEPHLEMDKVRK